MYSKHSNLNGRRLRVFLLVVVILVMGTTLVLAGASNQTWDPALAWEGEASGYQLSGCGQSVSQNYEVIGASTSSQNSYDPALDWEGKNCLVR